MKKHKALAPISSDNELKRYFDRIFQLNAKDEEFPVHLDEVWPLVYTRKEEAVRALKNDTLFIQDVDYKLLRKNAEMKRKDGRGHRQADDYMLSVECLEWFIVRRERRVFNVYRKLFHEVTGQYLPRYYKRKMNNKMFVQIGLEPKTFAEQDDIDTVAIVKTLQEKIKRDSLKSERVETASRAIRLAAKINDDKKRIEIIDTLTRIVV